MTTLAASNQGGRGGGERGTAGGFGPHGGKWAEGTGPSFGASPNQRLRTPARQVHPFPAAQIPSDG